MIEVITKNPTISSNLYITNISSIFIKLLLGNCIFHFHFLIVNYSLFNKTINNNNSGTAISPIDINPKCPVMFFFVLKTFLKCKFISLFQKLIQFNIFTKIHVMFNKNKFNKLQRTMKYQNRTKLVYAYNFSLFFQCFSIQISKSIGFVLTILVLNS